MSHHQITTAKIDAAGKKHEASTNSKTMGRLAMSLTSFPLWLISRPNTIGGRITSSAFVSEP